MFSGATDSLSTLAQHQARLAEIHYALDRIADSVLELPARLNAFTQMIRIQLGCDVCSIYVLDPVREELVLRATTGLAPTAIGVARLKMGEGVTGWVAEHLEPVALADAPSDPRFRYLPETREEQFRSLLSVPIVANQSFMGVINVQHRTSYPFSAQERLLVSAIGYKVGTVLRATALEDDLKQCEQALERLLSGSQALQRQQGRETTLAQLVAEGRCAVSGRGAILRLHDPESNLLKTILTDGSGHSVAAFPPLAPGEGVAGMVAATGKPLRLNEYPEFAERLVAVSAVSASLLCVPITDGAQVIGTLSAFDKQGALGSTPFTSRDQSILEGIARLLGLAITTQDKSGAKPAPPLEPRHFRHEPLTTVCQ